MDESVIQAKNLHKIYLTAGVETHALKGIDLDIQQGEFVIITGRNGSGKSTLMHQLALLDIPSKGQIFIHGKEVTHMPEKQRMNLRLTQLGYIFQEYALIAELTAQENIMLPSMMIGTKKQARKKAINLLNKVGLNNKHNRLPTQLSGGEQQKVAIARSLINEPRIIFADEPTANLDTIASKEVMEIFKTLSQKDKITIVMVSHEPEELVYASRHVILSDGELK